MRPVALITILVLTLASGVFAVPLLEMDETDFDFGYCPSGSQVSHVFWIKSAGDSQLEILQVIPGCGCTKAPLQSKLIEPGDSTRLEIIFSTLKFRNRVSKHPRIKANDGMPDHRLEIRAEIASSPDSTFPLTIFPNSLDMAVGHGKARTDRPFTLTNVSDRAVRIELVAIPEGLFRVVLPTVIQPGETLGGMVEVLTTPAEGFRKSFTIETSSPAPARYTIPVIFPITVSAEE